jgi:hypothetical protein
MVLDVFIDYPYLKIPRHKTILDCRADFYTYIYLGWHQEVSVLPDTRNDGIQEWSAEADLGKCLCEKYTQHPTQAVRTELETQIQTFPHSDYYKSTDDLDSICKYKDDYFILVLE